MKKAFPYVRSCTGMKRFCSRICSFRTCTSEKRQISCGGECSVVVVNSRETESRKLQWLRMGQWLCIRRNRHQWHGTTFGSWISHSENSIPLTSSNNDVINTRVWIMCKIWIVVDIESIASFWDQLFYYLKGFVVYWGFMWIIYTFFYLQSLIFNKNFHILYAYYFVVICFHWKVCPLFSGKMHTVDRRSTCIHVIGLNENYYLVESLRQGGVAHTRMTMFYSCKKLTQC